jgi:hypothetical protein
VATRAPSTVPVLLYQSVAATTPRSFAAGFAQTYLTGDLPACADDDRWALLRLQAKSGNASEALLAMVRQQPSRAIPGWAHAKQCFWRAGRRRAGWGPPEARRVDAALG